LSYAAAVSADRQQQEAASDSQGSTAAGTLGPAFTLEPFIPDQELLDDFLEALEQTGSPVNNAVLRAALGWQQAQYEAVKAELVARGIVKRGRGRSDSVSLVGAEPVAAPAPRGSNGPRASRK
jgi:hypothetical protein